MKLKESAILHFSRTPLKHPMSKYLLQFILDAPELLKRITFVRNREHLPNTMLVSELGSPRVGFELELGVRQREEVSIINGELVRQTRRDRNLCINEPMEAIAPLRFFRGHLYVTFSFCGPMPPWYLNVLESPPASLNDPHQLTSVDRVLREILRDQLDLAIQAILIRAAIDQALANRDLESFRQNARIYREVMNRCLWGL
jgi:uncharacterized protein YpiB (UPF0302 family)